MKLKKFVTLLLMAPVLLMTGCDTVMLGGGAAVLNYFERPDVNLLEKNYAAADYLMQAGGNFVVKNRDTVKAVTLQNVSEPQLTAKLGWAIAKQTGERLRQLGYNVDLSEVTHAVEDQLPYTSGASKGTPDYILSGVYFRAKTKVDVRLRLQDVRSGRVVAEFNYPLPMSHDIQDLSKPETRIYRTNGQSSGSKPCDPSCSMR